MRKMPAMLGVPWFFLVVVTVVTGLAVDVVVVVVVVVDVDVLQLLVVESVLLVEEGLVVSLLDVLLPEMVGVVVAETTVVVVSYGAVALAVEPMVVVPKLVSSVVGATTTSETLLPDVVGLLLLVQPHSNDANNIAHRITRYFCMVEPPRGLWVVLLEYTGVKGFHSGSFFFLAGDCPRDGHRVENAAAKAKCQFVAVLKVVGDKIRPGKNVGQQRAER